jgi:hypothetical protein
MAYIQKINKFANSFKNVFGIKYDHIVGGYNFYCLTKTQVIIGSKSFSSYKEELKEIWYFLHFLTSNPNIVKDIKLTKFHITRNDYIKNFYVKENESKEMNRFYEIFGKLFFNDQRIFYEKN